MMYQYIGVILKQDKVHKLLYPLGLTLHTAHSPAHPREKVPYIRRLKMTRKRDIENRSQNVGSACDAASHLRSSAGRIDG